MSLWFAEKDGFTFAADDPIQLLGLVTVYEDVQPKEDQPFGGARRLIGTNQRWGEQLLDQAIAVEEARVAGHHHVEREAAGSTAARDSAGSRAVPNLLGHPCALRV